MVQIHPDPPVSGSQQTIAKVMVFLSSENYPDIGAIAQLGEHLLCKQGVRGSIPRSSTMLDKSMQCVFLPNVNRKVQR